MNATRFNRSCSIAALLFLLVSNFAKLAWYEHRGYAPWQDYPQYYMGGLIARLGEWDSLYPIPNPDASTNPGFAGNSELRPRYREIADRIGIGEYAVRYMQPPPLAILLIPLSLLPFRVSFYLWILLLILATWGIGLLAGRMYTLSIARESKVPGALVLLICLSPLAHRWISVANMSGMIGFLVGYVTLELFRRDGARAAAVMVAGSVAKYALLVLGPLMLALRRWRTIAWSLAMGIGLFVISLLVMGTGPYTTFASDIAPILGRSSAIPENEALYAVLLRSRGIERETEMPRGIELGFRAVQIVTILTIIALILLKPLSFWRFPPHVFAAGAALVCWLLIFSPIYWEHYVAYLAPFWGWLAFEATRSRLRATFAVLSIALAIAPWALVMRHLDLPRPPEFLAVTLLWSAILMLGLAMATLVRRVA